jgi:6-pyruvoyltetrahydropterin/6-carboxytetrahydropterin synthase
MIYLTRGIVFYLDPVRRRVLPERADSLSLGAVRIKLWVTLAGQPNPQTGMLINVANISRTVRDSLAGYPAQSVAVTANGLLEWCRSALRDKFPGLDVTQIKLEPDDRLSLTLRSGVDDMVEVSFVYELAAAHCLHNSQWDASRNFEAFGRCSNPAGHGHNYRLEVTLRGKPDKNTGQLTAVGSVDKIVGESVLQRFDHKNLNDDCAEFRDLTPTVENMVRVFWEMLDGKFGDARLQRVRVWETANTYADYYGPGAGELRFSDNL